MSRADGLCVRSNEIRRGDTLEKLECLALLVFAIDVQSAAPAHLADLIFLGIFTTAAVFAAVVSVESILAIQAFFGLGLIMACGANRLTVRPPVKQAERTRRWTTTTGSLLFCGGFWLRWYWFGLHSLGALFPVARHLIVLCNNPTDQSMEFFEGYLGGF